MKKIILAFAMLVSGLAANAGVFSLGKTTFNGVAGGTVVIPVELTLEASEVNLYQTVFFTVSYSNTDFTSKGVAMASERMVAGQEYDPAVSGSTVSVVGKNPNAKIAGASGDVMYLTVNIPASAASGTTCTVSFTNPKAGDSDLHSYILSFADPAQATITVVDYVTIDENEAFTPTANLTKDVHLIRSFEAGKYYTLVLPFAAPAAKLTGAFGTAPTVYNFTGVTYDDVAAKITLNFASATGMAANRPYIILANADATEPVFSAVKQAVADPVYAQTEEEVTFADVVFTGTYTPNTVVPAGALYLKSSDAKLYVSQGGTKMKGTRAYMDIRDLGATFDAKGCILSLDGQETAIDAIDADLKAEGWFDLNGRKLADKPATKGVYISNGKKVVVK